MGGAQVGDGEFGVVFEGVEGFVAEELLDMVHVGAGAQELGRAGAAEGVGVTLTAMPRASAYLCTSRRKQ